MSSSTTRTPESLAENLAGLVGQTALASSWEQWRSIGGLAAAADPFRVQSIVDPEALVLLTLLVRTKERRLDDFLGWLLSSAATLLSVQRAQNLAVHYPKPAREGLGAFARLATESGDRRWRRIASGTETEIVLDPRSKKGPEQPALDASPALMLRLRAGLGVGTKADLLTFLLGIEGRFVTIREAAEALDYTDIAVRTTAQEMALANLVKAEPGQRPARYSASRASWSKLLGFEESAANPWPAWRNWTQVFAFFGDVLEWNDNGRKASWSTYVWGSRARDLVEDHLRVFTACAVEVPSAGRQAGLPYLEAFAAAVRQVCSWTRGHL